MKNSAISIITPALLLASSCLLAGPAFYFHGNNFTSVSHPGNVNTDLFSTADRVEGYIEFLPPLSPSCGGISMVECQIKYLQFNAGPIHTANTDPNLYSNYAFNFLPNGDIASWFIELRHENNNPYTNYFKDYIFTGFDSLNNFDEAALITPRNLPPPYDYVATEVGNPGVWTRIQLPGIPVMNGSAHMAGALLNLTPDAPMQKGSAFLPEPFNLTSNSIIHTHFSFQIGGVNLDSEQGADGLAFVMQNDPRAAAALGNDGEGIGFGINDTTGNPVNPISSSIAIEFDTHQNSFPLRATGDPNGNHLALIINGQVYEHIVSYSPSFLLNDGAPHYVWIDYFGNTKNFTVYIANSDNKPLSPVISTTLDLAGLGNQAYFGFTAATGDGFNSHDILAWNLNVITADLNGDNCIDQTDLSALLASINTSGTTSLTYDINGDGKVNIADARSLVLLFTHPRGAACH